MPAARNISIPSVEILQAIGAALEGLDRTGVLAILVYGSALGSHFRSDSDLDVAVVDRLESPASEATLALLMDAIERRTGRAVDLRRFADLSLSHQAHVLEQGTSVWIGDPPVFEAFRRDLLRRNAERSAASSQAWPALLERLRREHAA